MTFVSQGVSVRCQTGNLEATGYWSGTKNPRCTLSHSGAAICVTAPTSVLARSAHSPQLLWQIDLCFSLGKLAGQSN
jgi:hypothetical protein